MEYCLLKIFEVNVLYNKKTFGALLKKAQGRRSLNDYARDTNVSAGYISKLIRGLNKQPPSPQILEKLANPSAGVSYLDLMKAAGHVITIENNEKDRLKRLYLEWHLSDKKFESIHNSLSNIVAKLDEKDLNELDSMLKTMSIEEIRGFINFSHMLDQSADVAKSIPIISKKISQDELLVNDSMPNYLSAKAEDSLFYLESPDNSMSDLIKEDNLLLIKAQQRLFVDNVYAFLKYSDSSIIIRRVKQINDNLFLLPDNFSFPAFEYKDNDFQVIGIVDSIIKKI